MRYRQTTESEAWVLVSITLALCTRAINGRVYCDGKANASNTCLSYHILPANHHHVSLHSCCAVKWSRDLSLVNDRTSLRGRTVTGRSISDARAVSTSTV